MAWAYLRRFEPGRLRYAIRLDVTSSPLPMPKPKLNRTREHRIADEIVVDAYNETERATGWYCYLEEKLELRLIPSRLLEALLWGHHDRASKDMVQ